MINLSECRFCNIYKGNVDGKENSPIWEDENYYALASIGALVPGWVLVVPKEHMLSIQHLYGKYDFVRFTNKTLHGMRLRYASPVIAFEHGSNRCDSATSCGTSHAHLHLVPYHKSLRSDMLAHDTNWERCSASQIPVLADGHEYLFYAELTDTCRWEDPVGFLHVLEKSRSQYFRQLMANQLNCVGEYDYKRYPRTDVAIKTKSELVKILAG